MARIRHGRYVGFMLLLFLATSAFSFETSLAVAFAVGFDIAALGFLLSSLPHWSEGAPQTIRDQAGRDVGGRIAILLMTVAILAAVLIAVANLMSIREHPEHWYEALSLLTLVEAWVFANLVMAYHYAHRFYDSDELGRDVGGLRFPGNVAPCFADFVNFAFVLGMTSQTADIEITGAPLRRMATVHGMVAFFFNLGVVAFAINLVATAI